MATRTNPGGYPGFIPPVTPPPASPTKANPPAVAASFRDWLVTHNWKLHRAGVALLAVSCLVRSFTRGDAAVDDLDAVFVASYTLLGAFLARTFLDPKGYRASFEFHVIVAEAVSTFALHLDDPARRPGANALTWALVPMSAVLACIALRFQFKAQVGWHLLINISAFLARELVAGNAKRANPNDTELLSVMHRYNSALATAIAVFGHYAIERNERALFAAARARGIGREGGGGGASSATPPPGSEPPTSPSSKIKHHHQHRVNKVKPHRQGSGRLAKLARHLVPSPIRALTREQWSDLTSSAMLLVGVSYQGRNTFRGFSILRESARNGATIFETLRAATPCERMAAAQLLGVFAVLAELLAGWGTPRGRGAYAAYARRARSRQQIGLACASAPRLLAHLAGCQSLSLTRGANPGAELANRCAGWVFMGTIYSHGIEAASWLPFCIVTLTKAGGHVASVGSPGAVLTDFNRLVVEIVPPAAAAAVVARLVNWRAARRYRPR